MDFSLEFAIRLLLIDQDLVAEREKQLGKHVCTEDVRWISVKYTPFLQNLEPPPY